MNNQKMLDVVTMIANIILPDECDHGSALEIWLRAMKRKAREALESHESEAVGNAAAMREALEAIRNLAYEVQDMNREGDVKTSMPPTWVIDIVSAALSAPPRQCDVGTAEEQSVRMENEFCSKHLGCVRCQIRKSKYSDCSLTWAQTPYAEEGGAE